MRVYLADLAHDYMPARQFAPLGIGYLAAYLKKHFGDDVEVKLFKSCDRFLDALDAAKPDLVGLANYTWSAELSAFVGRKAKVKYPDLPIVMGGPNVRTDPEGLKSFLNANEYVDAYVVFAGEVALASFVEGLMKYPDAERSGHILRNMDLNGVYALRDGQLIGNSDFHKEKDLDFIPSPYQMGILDEFLDAGFIPILESNRGCPFTCTFCVWGISALNKLSMFSMERIAGDLAYVTGRGRPYPQLVFADANFGILPRDVDIARMVRDAYERTNSFSSVEIYWSKSAQPHMVDIGKILGSLTHTYIAFQSLDETVLSAIRRRNISTDKLLGLINRLRGFTHGARTDILVGLPEETFESHLKSLDKALSYGINHILGGEIRMLPGSEMDTPHDREKYGIRTKWRLYEGGAGVYRGEMIYELEECIRGTNAMSEEEMISLRGIRALFFNGVTLGSLRPLIHVLVTRKIRVTELFRRMLESRNLSPVLTDAFGWLFEQARQEWYDSPADIRNDLQKPGRAELLLGEAAFVKLNYGFTARLLLDVKAYKAYWRLVEDVAIQLAPDISPRAISGILDLCRARDYLFRALHGDPEIEREYEIDPEAAQLLVDTDYLPADTSAISNGTLLLEIEDTVGKRICKALAEDEISLFRLSQVMQMFLGRCHLEPRELMSPEMWQDVPPEIQIIQRDHQLNPAQGARSAEPGGF